jgi:hypothetical protein
VEEFMKVSGKETKDMDRVQKDTFQATTIKEALKMVKQMDTGYLLG